MAELTQGERLQPSLLDRLLDDHPEKSKDLVAGEPESATSNGLDGGRGEFFSPMLKHGASNQTINARQLKECVKRDLGWLLNAGCLEDILDLSSLPNVSESVLNFGMPDLTGIVASKVDVLELETKLAAIILRYEPRILKSSLNVSVSSTDEMSRNALILEIECDVWGEPVPERMYLHSEIDLETGAFNFQERIG